MDLDQRATETARTIATHPLCDLEQLGEEYAARIILSALNKVVKETREDLLELLASTDETVALHSKLTGKYRGI